MEVYHWYENCVRQSLKEAISMFGFLRKHSSEKHEERNRAFKEKYSQFRELLDRNHEVLETITELSEIKEKRIWRIRSITNCS